MRMIFAFLLLVYQLQIFSVDGHGRLLEPPSRNTAWRFGYSNPPNYNDNENYCGGFQVHYIKNGGKCGICGDNYADKIPRKHEVGGPFANGITTGVYIMGQVVEILVELTTNHWGYFVTKLCPHNDRHTDPPEECFDRYVLPVVDGASRSTEYRIPENSPKSGLFSYKVKLPEDITCTDCILKWIYYAGNTWDICPDGTGRVGCGDQETFINCADVAIVANTRNFNHFVRTHLLYNTRLDQQENNIDSVYLTNRVLRRPLLHRHSNCIPKQKYIDVPNKDKECRENCLLNKGNCKTDECVCFSHCRIHPGAAIKYPNRDDTYCSQKYLSPSYLDDTGINYYQDVCKCS